jgi:hypothetical protein
MIVDWPGERFTTTHRCFGGPCKNNQLMQKSAPAPGSGVTSFRIGDMQEHRYPYARAWKANAWSHDESAHLENIGSLVRNHWDPVNKRIKSHWEVLHEREIADDKRIEQQSKLPAFVLPNNIVDDWTGQKYLEPCHGAYPCPDDKKTLVQLNSEIELE